MRYAHRISKSVAGHDRYTLLRIPLQEILSAAHTKALRARRA